LRIIHICDALRGCTWGADGYSKAGI
jgi:hypothetical protein